MGIKILKYLKFKSQKTGKMFFKGRPFMILSINNDMFTNVPEQTLLMYRSTNTSNNRGFDCWYSVLGIMIMKKIGGGFWIIKNNNNFINLRNKTISESLFGYAFETNLLKIGYLLFSLSQQEDQGRKNALSWYRGL